MERKNTQKEKQKRNTKKESECVCVSGAQCILLMSKL